MGWYTKTLLSASVYNRAVTVRVKSCVAPLVQIGVNAFNKLVTVKENVNLNNLSNSPIQLTLPAASSIYSKNSNLKKKEKTKIYQLG